MSKRVKRYCLVGVTFLLETLCGSPRREEGKENGLEQGHEDGDDNYEDDMSK